MVTVIDKAKNIPQWSQVVKDRDSWKCQKCGTTVRKNLVAHHIDTSDDMRLIVANGQTLCLSCHRKLASDNEAKMTVQVKVSTMKALKELGSMMDTYDSVICRLLAAYKGQ